MSASLVAVKGKVLCNQALSGGYYQLSLAAPALVARACPGQFVMVRVGPWHDPLLRRPLSLSSWDDETGVLRLWIEPRGRGTKALKQVKPGDELDLLGPLGRGFPAAKKNDTLLVVGGGIGVAPLVQVVSQAIEVGASVRVCLGARSISHLLGVEEMVQRGVPVDIATDDGSRGHHGRVTELAKEARVDNETKVMACGPWPMLKVLRNIAVTRQWLLHVSLEAYMACAVGACQGCAVKAADKDGYYRVCKDGPVFSHMELDWNQAGEGCS